MMLLLLVASGVIALSALCSMSEAAFLSLPLVRARALAKLGGPTAKAVLRLREKVQNAVSAIVILNTVVNVLGTALLTTMAERQAEAAAQRGDLIEVSAAWLAAIFTVAIVFLGEIIPKTLGERFHVGICMAAAFPTAALIAIFHPAVWITETVVNRFAPGRRHSVTSAEEITELAEQARSEGAIRSSEADVIQRVFRLNDITAEDLMTPRIRAKMLPADATLEDVQEELGVMVFSRFPVYSGTRDNVLGIVGRAEAFRALAEGKGGTRLSELALKTRFFPATMPGDKLLLEFQKERVQLGIVVGEYGETIGIVSLEDVMEELVGEALDEKNLDERTIKRVSREEILVHGQTGIAHINHFFNTEIPEERPTIAGYLLDKLGRLPRAGEHVVADGVDVVIDEVSERAILRVRILKGKDGTDRAAAPAGGAARG
jgi:CBS domain containing-hemolysin-like protein